LASHRKADDQNLAVDDADRAIAYLPTVISGVELTDHHRIVEHIDGISEIDPVLGQIAVGFCRVPLEIHPEKIYGIAVSLKTWPQVRHPNSASQRRRRAVG